MISCLGCFSFTYLLLIVGGNSWNVLLMFQHVSVTAFGEVALLPAVFVGLTVVCSEKAQICWGEVRELTLQKRLVGDFILILMSPGLCFWVGRLVFIICTKIQYSMYLNLNILILHRCLLSQIQYQTKVSDFKPTGPVFLCTTVADFTLKSSPFDQQTSL